MTIKVGPKKSVNGLLTTEKESAEDHLQDGGMTYKRRWEYCGEERLKIEIHERKSERPMPVTGNLV